MFDIPLCFLSAQRDMKATALKVRHPPMVGWTKPYGDTRRMREVALALLPSQWELSAISISFVRQDVEDTPIKKSLHARTRFLHSY